MEIFECVPNISAGASPEVVDAIITELSSSGISILHVDRGPGVNRTVLTLAGTYQQVFKAAVDLYSLALAKIDMRQHRGVHPRLGAVDVCPIIPLFGSSMDRAIRLAREIGWTVFERFNLPVFFYEEAAYSHLHRQLPKVRQGEFEGLPSRADRPDLWGGAYHPTGGATIIGARKILIAYNITLTTSLNPAQGVQLTRKLAANLRSKVTRCPESGLPVGGSLPHLRAIGWQLADTKELQISCNLTDYTVTSIPSVFRVAARLIQGHGGEITSSEVIGLCPAKAILEDRFKMPSVEELKQNPNLAEELSSQISLAAARLKLRDFDPKLKILELVCAKKLAV